MLYGQLGGDPATSAKNAFSLQHVTLKGSKSNGVVISDTASFSDDSTDLVVTGSALYPISLPPRVLSSLPAGTYTGNAQDEILLPGAGVTGDVITDQTMHDRGVPYHVGIPSAAGQSRVGASSTAVPSRPSRSNLASWSASRRGLTSRSSTSQGRTRRRAR